MGIHITAFAIDCGGFRDWLAKPVGEVLFYIARHGKCEPPSFFAYDPHLRHRYHARANGEVLGFEITHPPTPAPVRIDSRDVSTTPLLSRQLGRYLRDESSYAMKFLFHSMSRCPNVAWVRLLTEGYRPGWIFSLLIASREVSLPPTELTDLERLCARILRGYNYPKPAYPLEPNDILAPPDSLPVFPAEDLDAKLGVLTPPECDRWFDLVDSVLMRNPKFRVPGDATDTEHEKMDEVVRSILASLATMRQMQASNPSMVTFIS